MKETFSSVNIEDNHDINQATEPGFLLELQNALLLGLKESGKLNERQYHIAFQNLRKQYTKLPHFKGEKL